MKIKHQVFFNQMKQWKKIAKLSPFVDFCANTCCYHVQLIFHYRTMCNFITHTTNSYKLRYTSYCISTDIQSNNNNHLCGYLYYSFVQGGRRGRDRMVVQLPMQSVPITLMLWVRISIKAMCTKLCDKVCQWLARGRWFSPGTPVSSTNETDRHDITEILLKVKLGTIKQTNKQNFRADE